MFKIETINLIKLKMARRKREGGKKVKLLQKLILSNSVYYIQ